MHVTTVPLALSCHAGCSSSESWLGKTGLFPSEACMSCTMKFNPQGRSFRISSRSQTSGLVSEAMGSYLPTLEATKAIAMVYNVWGVSWITMINSSKEDFSYLVLVFFLVGL